MPYIAELLFNFSNCLKVSRFIHRISVEQTILLFSEYKTISDINKMLIKLPHVKNL